MSVNSNGITTGCSQIHINTKFVNMELTFELEMCGIQGYN